eukprot:413487-Pelagomonas_calceolata.AAC.1
MRIRRVVSHAPRCPESPPPGIHLRAPSAPHRPKPPVSKERVWYSACRSNQDDMQSHFVIPVWISLAAEFESALSVSQQGGCP